MWFEELTGLPLSVLEKESNIRVSNYSKNAVTFVTPGVRGSYKVIVERTSENLQTSLLPNEKFDISIYKCGALNRYLTKVRQDQCLNKIEQATGNLIG